METMMERMQKETKKSGEWMIRKKKVYGIIYNVAT